MTPEGGPDLGGLYGGVRQRVISQVLHGLDDEEAKAPVPACPGWSVHDLVAHMVGITTDALAGNMDGAPGPAWTAAHVERRRDATLRQLIEEWDANAALFEQRLSVSGIAPAVLDIATHEQDLRGALGIVGARDNPAIGWALPVLIDGFGAKVEAAGLAPVLVDLEAGDQVAGDGDPGVTLRTTRFDFFRAVFGRRSRAQIESLGWSADPAPYLEHLVIFGPAEADLEE